MLVRQTKRGALTAQTKYHVRDRFAELNTEDTEVSWMRGLASHEFQPSSFQILSHRYKRTETHELKKWETNTNTPPCSSVPSVFNLLYFGG